MPVFAVCIAETDWPRVGGGREERRKLLSAERTPGFLCEMKYQTFGH